MEYLEGKEFLGDFAQRTLSNLNVITKEAYINSECYEVTQLINSLLGLIVFPFERNIKTNDDNAVYALLAEYVNYPENDISADCIIKNMRHAISHSHVLFVKSNQCDDNGKAKINGVIFISCKYINGKPQCPRSTTCHKCNKFKKKNNEHPDFQLIIPVNKLRDFIETLAKEIIKSTNIK